MAAKEPMKSKAFRPHGGYQKLVGYRIAELLSDYTMRFVKKFIDPASRTRDQMEQAARSGSRNIAEGSIFSATSKKIEMNLTNVARASMLELQKDYQAFLRQNGLAEWPGDDPIRQELIDRRFGAVDPLIRWVKEVNGRFPERSMEEIAGNVGAVLSNVVIAMYTRLLDRQGHDFEEQGGFGEHLYRIRKETRQRGE